MADTDQHPTQGTKRMGQGIDWRGLSTWGGATLAVVGLSVGAWLHGALIGHGDRLTAIETREQARDKQGEKEAQAATKTLDEIRGDIRDLTRAMEAVRLEIARGQRTPTGGAP